MRNRLGLILFVVAILLLIPLIAMQFTTEVNWNSMDFLVAGGLLTGAGLAVSYFLSLVKKPGQKITLVLVTLAIVLVLWVEMAVGLLGSPLAGS